MFATVIPHAAQREVMRRSHGVFANAISPLGSRVCTVPFYAAARTGRHDGFLSHKLRFAFRKGLKEVPPGFDGGCLLFCVLRPGEDEHMDIRAFKPCL
jgi:hypothetical protein